MPLGVNGIVVSQRSPHSEILACAGEAHLAPLGLVRRGKSRTWFRDNGWWLSIVEFQPSAWSKGSYLNVAAMWLWYPKDHFTFDECVRVGRFVEFGGAESFPAEADALGRAAAGETSKNLERFASIAKVAAYLNGISEPTAWQRFHAMMASLAVDDVEPARRHQASLAEVHHPTDWFAALQARAKAMVESAAESRPRDLVAFEVQRAREMLSLPAISSDQLWS